MYSTDMSLKKHKLKDRLYRNADGEIETHPYYHNVEQVHEYVKMINGYYERREKVEKIENLSFDTVGVGCANVGLG